MAVLVFAFCDEVVNTFAAECAYGVGKRSFNIVVYLVTKGALEYNCPDSRREDLGENAC